MNILKEVLKHEVFPALGCTEPIAVAYAASVAASQLSSSVTDLTIIVNPGIYKNGLAVTIPNTKGLRGNLIAGTLGALIKKPALKMEILKDVTTPLIRRAQAMIKTKKAKISYNPSKTEFYIEVRVKAAKETARAVIEQGHTNLVCLEKNHRTLLQLKPRKLSSKTQPYKKYLKQMSIGQLIDAVRKMDASDYAFMKDGIAMNSTISQTGQRIKKVGYYLNDLLKKGYLQDDVFSRCKIMVSSAADARMAGLNYPVMSSGGSGNQGIVAILVPFTVGSLFHVKQKTILQSIALSHLVNSYIKCYTGDLSPLCGCSIAAGAGAAVAIVYQQKGKDLKKITLAVNNLISDLGGMLCDGAKGGCALKVVSSTDSAIRCAYMAMHNHGITEAEGFIGKTAEETIRNLSKISIDGMANVDNTMLVIMKEKKL